MTSSNFNKTLSSKIVLIFSTVLSGSLIFAQHAHHHPAVVRQIDTIQNQRQNLTVEYDLIIADTLVNYTGAKKKAMSINGAIPGPTLYIIEGDTAIIRVHNRMHMETSIQNFTERKTNA